MQSLKDGTFGINDLWDMHEVLDEEAEYRRRWEEVLRPDE
jgi:hypothetical protein